MHLTPKIFFAKIIRLILWSNLAKKNFDLVKSSNFYAPSKPSFHWVATAHGESGESVSGDVKSRTNASSDSEMNVDSEDSEIYYIVEDMKWDFTGR